MGYPDFQSSIERLESLLRRIALAEARVRAWTEAMHSDEIHEIYGRLLESAVDPIAGIVAMVESLPYPSEQPKLGTAYEAMRPLPAPGATTWEVIPRSDYAAKLREPHRQGDSSPRQLTIDVYVEGDLDSKAEENRMRAVIAATHRLAESVGAEKISVTDEGRGSLWERARARLGKALTSDDARKLQEEAIQAVRLRGMLLNQAEYDGRQAQAVGDLVLKLAGVRSAAIRVGSILIVKYSPQPDDPIILCRTLTAAEVRALDQFPAILHNPPMVMDQLAQAVNLLSDEDPPSTAIGNA
ncbi:hypothetical protein E0H73_22045 [Kribbella pittospori]|uniref:Uncharacterized protein n=1 Tax=Kribbella pittospori TaxID=722689 RepID=A0A4R0KNW1_9ACTN|nr:hypothetical protein [Kribbella pittospori]TCC60606.1 hypothetical protein E0H73_22045 [Kribbella pittospori]